MRRALTTAMVMLVAALAAAGCGDDDSSDGGSAATVPDDRLGAQNADSCQPPAISGYTVDLLHAFGSTCSTAELRLRTYMATGRVDSHTCARQVTNGTTDVLCTRQDDSTRGFRARYRAAARNPTE